MTNITKQYGSFSYTSFTWNCSDNIQDNYKTKTSCSHQMQVKTKSPNTLSRFELLPIDYARYTREIW